MAMLMQFSRDTEAPGRFFPHGSRVLVMPVGSAAMVLPDAEAHTLMCVVPMANLQTVRRFRVQMVNRAVGLFFEQLLLGTSEADVRSRLASDAPDCDVVEMREVHGQQT